MTSDKTRHSIAVVAAALSIGVFGATASWAQDFGQVAPQLPVPVSAESATPTLPEPPAADATQQPGGQDLDTVLVSSLRGLVFITNRNMLKPEGMDTVGIQADSPILQGSGFKIIVTPYVGQPVTMRRLNAMAAEVVGYFRSMDRPVVDVLVPEQNISNGTVQVIVLEGKLANVSAQGNEHVTSSALTSQIRTKAGQSIVGSSLLADVAWLNQNPFRQVDLVFARGDQPGDTNVILRTKDRRPVRLFVGNDDTGNKATKDERILMGANLGRGIRENDMANYQFMASPDFDTFRAHSASYIMPTDWRHVITVFGSYATIAPDFADGLFHLTGKSWQVSERYRMPLHSSPEMTTELSLGTDFKSSNNDLAFGGETVYTQATHIFQAIGD